MKVHFCSVVVLFLFFSSIGLAETSIIVTKGATTDHSAFVAHTEPWVLEHNFFTIKQTSTSDTNTVILHSGKAGDSIGRVDLVGEMFHVTGSMNSRQVCILPISIETKKELQQGNGILTLHTLSSLALKTAINARHAIKKIDELAREYGFSGKGGCISIVGPGEAWLMELSGKGAGEKGIVWVALKIPDGSVAVQANILRIGTFPLYNSSVCLYSPDIFDFAEKNNLFRGKPEHFSFKQAFVEDNASFTISEARIWSVLSRCAPSEKLQFQYPGRSRKNELPLWIEPDEKLCIGNVMALLRNHFEQTPLDLYDSEKHKNFVMPYYVDFTDDRCISNNATLYTAVYQVRYWMPYMIGGVVWFCPGNSYFFNYSPVYSCSEELPERIAESDNSSNMFSLSSSIATFCVSGTDENISSVIRLQDSLEFSYLNDLRYTDSVACQVYSYDPDSAISFLQSASLSNLIHSHVAWNSFRIRNNVEEGPPNLLYNGTTVENEN